MSQFVICSEDSLASKYETVIQPFWQNSVQQGMFEGKGEVEIAGKAEKMENVDIAYAYVLHPQAIGSVVISSGRIESLIKYKEVVYDLYQNGYSVFIHDHRGQGLSGRMLKNPQIGYVSDFAEYVADFKKFMDEVVTKKTLHKPKLLCHSMGGAIGALTVLRYPELFEKIAFSAPMFGIRPALPNWFATLLLNLHGALNTKNAYFFGQEDYNNHSFTVNELTHSETRYQIFRQEYQTTPQVHLGGVSGHWLKVAAQAIDQIEQNVHRFPIPSLVIQAGADQIVDNKRQSRVVEKMAHSQLAYSKLIVIEGSKHELLEEQDKFRVPCLTAILEFFIE
jgi:lysophospholipase